MSNVWLAGLTAVVLGAASAVATAADATPGPLMRAALANLDPQQAKSPTPRSGKSRDDWSRVLKLSPGADVILTQKGSRAATHPLLRAAAD